ncbi:unnamed protein product [Lasius platythorax]|uniref:Methyltransferase domain-containing protein n=1 Tax=Lasius platythorax TaxID=488582 RepID=A0AAV2PF86_9HYME
MLLPERYYKIMVNPEQYVSLDNMSKRNVSHIINEFAKDLKNISGKCMDVGCGPGDITRDILLSALNSKATMIGTDIMENMIEYANKTYGDKERLEFEVLDIQTKNLPEKYISEFDHIFSFHALQWCSDIRQTFENIYCMLRPGKTMLILSVAQYAAFFESLESMAQDIRYASYMGDKKKYVGPFHYSARPREDLKELLEDIGFQVHHCSHREISNCMSTEKFMSFVTAQYTFAFLDKMPHNLREEFKNEFTRMYTEINVKEYRDRQGYSKLHDEEKETDISSAFFILVAYAQKNVS